MSTAVIEEIHDGIPCIQNTEQNAITAKARLAKAYLKEHGDNLNPYLKYDMEKATALARAMVTQYGMCDSFGLMSLEKNEDTYLTGRTSLNCSDQTATKIDNEVNALLKACYERAIKLLSENKDVLAKIADYLYEKETITGAQFMEIYKEVKQLFYFYKFLFCYILYIVSSV